MSVQELLILMAVIAILSVTGLWPDIIKALRELRGEEFSASSKPPSREVELASKLLGVSPSASWEEIERAYRRKAKIHHPDVGGDEDAMKALNDAYNLLKKLKGVK